MRAAYTLLLPICAFGTLSLAAAAARADEPTGRDRVVAHSYRRDDIFANGEWESIDVTDEPYKYKNDSVAAPPAPRSRKARAAAVKGGIVHAINQSWNNLKGIGKSSNVLITWYASRGVGTHASHASSQVYGTRPPKP